MNVIPINHISYFWETNSCQVTLKDRGFIECAEIDLNEIVKRYADLFLKCCHKTVLYCQRKGNDWEIIIPASYKSYVKDETFTTLDAFIFQNHKEYVNIFCQTSYYLVTEKNRYTIVKYNVEEHIENLSDVVKQRLSENYKLGYVTIKERDSNPFGKVVDKKSETVSKFGVKKSTKVVNKKSQTSLTNKFAKVPIDANTAAPTVTKTIVAKTSLKRFEKVPTDNFDNVPALRLTVPVTNKSKTTIEKPVPIVWEIQEDWD